MAKAFTSEGVKIWKFKETGLAEALLEAADYLLVGRITFGPDWYSEAMETLRYETDKNGNYYFVFPQEPID